MGKIIGLIALLISMDASAKQKLLYCEKSYMLNKHQHYDCTFDNNSLVARNDLGRRDK